MSFYVDGTVVTIYKKNDFKSKVNEVTGEAMEVTEGGHYVQVMISQLMEDGSAKAELIDFKTAEPEIYQPLLNKRNMLAVDFSHWNMNNRSGLSYKMLDSANKAKFNKTEKPQAAA